MNSLKYNWEGKAMAGELHNGMKIGDRVNGLFFPNYLMEGKLTEVYNGTACILCDDGVERYTPLALVDPVLDHSQPIAEGK